MGIKNQEYCTEIDCFHEPTYLQRKITYLEGLKNRARKRQGWKNINTTKSYTLWESDGEGDWRYLVGVPVVRECKNNNRHLQSICSEPRPNNMAMLNDVDPEEEDEQRRRPKRRWCVIIGRKAWRNRWCWREWQGDSFIVYLQKIISFEKQKANKMFIYHNLGQPF